MMRGMAGTIVWACLAAFVGIGLFFLKHEVKEQEARLSSLNQEIRRNQEAIHVLKAEWAYLNDPARLRQLSERHLGMKPMAPSQVSSLDALPRDAVPAGGPVLASAPSPAVAKAEPSKTAPVAVAKTEPVKPAAKAATVPVLAKSPAPKVVAGAPPKLAAAPVPVPPPAAPASVQPAPRRTIVIQSPALATTELNSSGEAR